MRSARQTARTLGSPGCFASLRSDKGLRTLALLCSYPRAPAGNDHRLGANEAPPAVVSVFLGDELTAVLDSIENEKPYNAAEKTQLKLGVHVLPKLPKDTTDRNRTSPFAFTGNKFEFRMLGSSNSIACANIMLNTSVAESLKQYADKLEGAADFNGALHELIRDTIKAHKRIVFNGNGYDEAWIKEAVEKRGLLNLRTTPDCMPLLLNDKNVELLTSHKVYSEAELRSRCDIMLDNYSKTINIEAMTMIDMARREIIPAVESYCAELAAAAASKKAVSAEIDCSLEKKLLKKLSGLSAAISDGADKLETAEESAKKTGGVLKEAQAFRDEVIPAMDELRAAADKAEAATAAKYWPYPVYGDLLFGVR